MRPPESPAISHRDLVKLERRTFRAAFDDGLWDILLGAHLTAQGLSLSMGGGSGWVGGVTGGLLFPLWLALRKSVTGPRVGHVRLSAPRMARIHAGPLTAIALILAIVALGVILTPARVPLLTGLVYAIPLAAAGFLLEIPRAYAYAAALLCERLIDPRWGGPSNWMYWPSGLAMIGCGVFLLRTFLLRYPKGANDDDESSTDHSPGN